MLWLRLNQKLRIGLVMRLFPVGQPLQITRKYSAKKRSSPLDFIFDTCASTSSSHFFGEAEHMCLYPFARANVSSPLQAFHGGICLPVITFVISELERQEKMSSAAGDIIAQSESTWVGLPYYRQTQIQLPVSKRYWKSSFSDV